MTAEYIYKCVRACVGVYGTCEPEKIFEMRGCAVKRRAPPGLCGMICVKDGRLVVYAGEESGASQRRIIVAKLLGHAIMHREELCGGRVFEYAERGTPRDPRAAEAALFAAELLIPDVRISELDKFGFTEGQIAASLGNMRALAAPKIYAMRCRGVSVCGSAARADFMKRCDVENLF